MPVYYDTEFCSFTKTLTFLGVDFYIYLLFTTWAAVLYRQIQTRAEGESLYVRYNTDANVVNGLKNSSSYEPTGEKSLEIDEVYAEKIKVKVYVNQQNSVS